MCVSVITNTTDVNIHVPLFWGTYARVSLEVELLSHRVYCVQYNGITTILGFGLIIRYNFLTFIFFGVESMVSPDRLTDTELACLRLWWFWTLNPFVSRVLSPLLWCLFLDNIGQVSKLLLLYVLILKAFVACYACYGTIECKILH